MAADTLSLLLADDDSDDRNFFAITLADIFIPTHLETVRNGGELMDYLAQAQKMPDVLFLDLNMPLKNGIECLTEIKASEKLAELPVVIYSTSLHYNVADQLYQMGAHYYVRKSDLEELTRVLQTVLDLIKAKKFTRPLREKFILSPVDGS